MLIIWLKFITFLLTSPPAHHGERFQSSFKKTSRLSFSVVDADINAVCGVWIKLCQQGKRALWIVKANLLLDLFPFHTSHSLLFFRRLWLLNSASQNNTTESDSVSENCIDMTKKHPESAAYIYLASISFFSYYHFKLIKTAECV